MGYSQSTVERNQAKFLLDAAQSVYVTLVRHLFRRVTQSARCESPSRVALPLVQNSVYSEDEDYAGH
jgi:hypothetical protein